MKTLLFLVASFLSIAIHAQNYPNKKPVLRPIREGVPTINASPDLIVSDISVGTRSTTNADGSLSVPIKVWVKNIGPINAEIFKVSVDYITAANQTFPVAFKVTGQSNMWYPFTTAALPAGAATFFEGVLVFPGRLKGSRITLKAIADSGSGDEFMPSYIRVKELSENNNISSPVWIVL